MVRIPFWLYLLLLPFMFFGGCVSAIPFASHWLEREYVQAVGADQKDFPVLVVNAVGVYAAASLGDIPTRSTIVVKDFDETVINRDLNRSIGGTGDHPYFQVLSQTSDVTLVSLEFPTLHDSKLQGWYEIKQGQINPIKFLLYGPGFAFVVMPFAFAGGIACVAIFTLFCRPKRKPLSGDVV